MKGAFRGYLVAWIAGAAVGGVAVAVATDAFPRLAQRILGVMADEMSRRGFSPDAWAERFRGLVEARAGSSSPTRQTKRAVT